MREYTLDPNLATVVQIEEASLHPGKPLVVLTHFCQQRLNVSAKAQPRQELNPSCHEISAVAHLAASHSMDQRSMPSYVFRVASMDYGFISLD